LFPLLIGNILKPEVKIQMLGMLVVQKRWWQAALVLAGCFVGWQLTQVGAQASYNSMFAREGYFSTHERLDVTKSYDRKISRYKSVYVTQTAKGRIRNASLMFYAKPQGQHFTHYASHWINVRTLRNGKLYAYNDQTVYGNYLVAYHEFGRGHGTTIYAGKRPVKLHYSKKGNLLFTYQKQTLTVHLNSGQVNLNGKTTSAKANRTFKRGVPTKGNRTSRLIADAKRYLGVPYRYAGRDAFGGLDCASFVDQVYLDVEHRDIGGMTGVQQKLGKHVAVRHAKKGDLLFWQIAGQKYTYHVAMAIGKGKLIEEAGKSVHVSKIANRHPQFAIHMK